jgi:hypothetical protein
MTTPPKHVSAVRKILAVVLDILTVFIGGGYAIAAFTGDTTDGGFQLNGGPALLLFALIAVYFIVLPRVGGTIWQRILRTR